MQSKLTLRLDEELIREAKAVAEARGTSLSRLVAGYFRALTQPAEPSDDDLPPITRALKGSLRGTEADEEEYYSYLERKHR